jgi:hypothetical protein
MGVYYWFADHTNKKFIDGYAAKSQEWRASAFDQAMIINYLMDNNDKNLRVNFAAEETGEWDEMRETNFEDYTCENIYSMFESGYFREYTSSIWLGHLTWILNKFSKENKLDLYLKIAKDVPEFMEHYKETICKTLEQSNEPVRSI